MIAYRPWHERYPARLEQERAGMLTRGFTLDEEALAASQLVTFTGALQNGWPVRIIYPATFPSKPPHLYTTGPAQHLPRHHHLDTHEICTFGPNQNRWNASMDGTAVIDEAQAVIETVLSGDNADTVPEPRSTQYRYVFGAAALIPFPLLFPLPTNGAVSNGTLRLRKAPIPQIKGAWRGVVLDVKCSGVSGKAAPPFTEWFRGAQEHKVTLLVEASTPTFTTPEQFKEYLKEKKVVRPDLLAIVFPEQSGSATEQGWSGVFVQSNLRFEYELIRTFILDEGAQQIRIPGLAALRDKKVLVIGCGCLGSKMTTQLAASGIRRFSLLDPDFMEPFNVVRHEVGVQAFGSPKAVALGEQLANQYGIAPAAIECGTWAIGGTNTLEQEQALFGMIMAADLIIEATGNHGVSHFVNDVCTAYNKPAVYVSVTNGAWSGEIVRYIPGQSACWNCWNAQYENERPPQAPTADVYAPGCDQPTFTGTTYETGMVASLATTVAVDLLRRSAPSEIDHDYLRWQSRDETGRFIFSTANLPVRKRQNCPFCNP